MQIKAMINFQMHLKHAAVLSPDLKHTGVFPNGTCDGKSPIARDMITEHISMSHYCLLIHSHWNLTL
jgi:hypothetical protein